MKFPLITIEKVVFGGEGLGRLPDGKIVFVPYVAPGEKVKVEIVKEFQDYAWANLVEVIENSPFRREPLCEYYFTCGGCQLQHLNYEYQLQLKKEIFLDTFRRVGWKEEIPLELVFPSPKEFFYRNKLRLHVENNPLKMGFVKRRSHEVLPIKFCYLAERKLNYVLKSLYEHPIWLKISNYSKRLNLEFSPEEDKTVLIFWSMLPPLEEDLEELSKIPELKAIFYWMRGRRPEGPFPKNSSYGGRRVFKGINQLTYYIQPGVFVQTNWEINLEIAKTFKKWIPEYRKVLDLHSGMGNFLFSLIDKGDRFLGVDTDLRAIEDALYILSKLNLNGRIDFRNISAHEALHEALKTEETFDLVILDPPRGGCKEILKLLSEVAEKYILYVSCDPPTLARDLLILKKLGYQLIKLALFDMFPQTYHLEVLSLLQKG
ncbi:MAG: 23S rRNA (uracil(1939)-C(5))-methyltransferase RlmD [Thermodesulfobacteriaceae bacterium]|nr:23S rRNA (uracil(1939)-C(5))-methyltransferase RlmD [Thermodesulfobacteriaceae bacterium]